MSKKETVTGILVNEDVFDFQDIMKRFLDSIQDFMDIYKGKGFNLKKDGYNDYYVKLCVFFDCALSHLDYFIDVYSNDFYERYSDSKGDLK